MQNFEDIALLVHAVLTMWSLIAMLSLFPIHFGVNMLSHVGWVIWNHQYLTIFSYKPTFYLDQSNICHLFVLLVLYFLFPSWLPSLGLYLLHFSLLVWKYGLFYYLVITIEIIACITDLLKSNGLVFLPPPRQNKDHHTLFLGFPVLHAFALYMNLSYMLTCKQNYHCIQCLLGFTLIILHFGWFLFVLYLLAPLTDSSSFFFF